MALTKEEITLLSQNSRKSILSTHKDDLLELKKAGVTLSNMQKWLLDECKIDTSKENIRQFCLRNGAEGVDDSRKKDTKSNSRKLFANIGKDIE